MIVYYTKVQEPYFFIPSSHSLERTLKEQEGYYDPDKIMKRKTLLTHAYSSHKPKEIDVKKDIK